jgi:endonuclease/exonuclease/phosphatase family metal-dependent hydrolase
MKLVQVNIEGDAHLPLVQDFIVSERPDVLCVQEIFKQDIPRVSTLPHVTFMPMLLERRADGSLDERGVVLMSSQEQSNTVVQYYYKPTETLVEQDRTSQETKRKTIQHGVIMTTIAGVRIGTVHHTWTQNGDDPSAYQIQDTEALMKYIQTVEPMILCGDFNIPRGYNSCYEILTSYFEDCVPRTYASSMHIPLHRVRNNPAVAAEVARYMVDYIFRTPGAAPVRDVVMKCGMSDHCALIAQIG